ncbi:hypothetical protein [Aquamicrobium sp.]|uniref:hypothetical protein n=1 Tax=Aquamicrobium sp. TaxID=1872579 RepID=UPI00258CB369|nr:hypothetical protein [Aquamicrobium sp.]MCK9553195.1 hypothetical protein [Aquamicrobium sp.]
MRDQIEQILREQGFSYTTKEVLDDIVGNALTYLSPEGGMIVTREAVFESILDWARELDEDIKEGAMEMVFSTYISFENLLNSDNPKYLQENYQLNQSHKHKSWLEAKELIISEYYKIFNYLSHLKEELSS